MRGYLSHYLRPWWLAPANIFDELLKPLTLGLRLFGMAFASTLMLLLIGELPPPHIAVLPHALWTLFDLFIGVIQAYVFALLTVLNFQAALPLKQFTPACSRHPREDARHRDDHRHHADDPDATLVIELASFLIVLLIVAKFVLPRLRANVEQRQASITESLAAVDAAEHRLVAAEAEAPPHPGGRTATSSNDHRPRPCHQE